MCDPALPEGTDLQDPPARPPSSLSGRVGRWLRRTATLLVFVAVVDYLVLPRMAGTEQSLHLLSTMRWPWIAAAVGLEALSLMSYSLLTVDILAEPRLSFMWVLRSDLAGLGIGHVLPGGAPTANALRFRLLRLGGAEADDVGISLAMQSVGATITLLALLWVAMLAAIPFYGSSPASLAVMVLGALAAVTLGVLARQRESLRAPLAAILMSLIQRVPSRFRPRLLLGVRGAAAHADALLGNPRALRACGVWAMGNWVLDAASLWVFMAAYGHRMNPIGLLAAYGIASSLALLPISPGGLGIVEGALIPSLLGFGAPSSVTVIAVLSWRLVEFWAPIPIGGLAYASLGIQSRLRSVRR